MKTNLELIAKLLRSAGYEVNLEHQFSKCYGRLWRMDLAAINRNYGLTVRRVCLEVQGGVFLKNGGGRHNRGAYMVKEWQKLNTAAAMGWLVVYCTPQDVRTGKAYTLVKNVLEENEEAVATNGVLEI